MKIKAAEVLMELHTSLFRSIHKITKGDY